MRFRVFDTETTGLPKEGEPNDHEVIEIAFTDVVQATGGQWTQDFRLEQLLYPAARVTSHPGAEIDIEALATHHITMHMLFGNPTSDRVNEFLHQEADKRFGMSDEACQPDIFVAHNIAFDGQFVDFKDKPFICTMKCAKWAWEDSPRHTNQVLRYYLGLKLLQAKCEPAHRAGPDTYVTSGIFIELLKLYPIEQLIEWTQQPTRVVKFSFGKYFGERLDNEAVVDDGYLNWIMGQDFDKDTKFAVDNERKRRAQAKRDAWQARQDEARIQREEDERAMARVMEPDGQPRLIPRMLD